MRFSRQSPCVTKTCEARFGQTIVIAQVVDSSVHFRAARINLHRKYDYPVNHVHTLAAMAMDLLAVDQHAVLTGQKGPRRGTQVRVQFKIFHACSPAVMRRRQHQRRCR